MGRKRPVKNDRARHWIVPGCDDKLAAGFRAIASALTPHHSLTSRRYSVWALVAENLDVPFGAVVASYRGNWSRRLLQGFRPSTAGRRPPQWIPAVNSKAPRLLVASNFPTSCTPGMPEVDWQIENVARWDGNLRAAIHGANADPSEARRLTLDDLELQGAFDPVTSIGSRRRPPTQRDGACVVSPLDRFCASLDSMWKFLDFLHVLRPRTGKDHNPNGWIRTDRLSDERTGLQGTTYCELCWRPSMRSEQSGQVDEPYSPAHRYSGRYCAVHNPSGGKSSCYHADVSRRALFQNELDALVGLRRSAYAFRFQPPPGADEEEMRKTAYDQVHAFLRRRLNPSPAELSLPERVWLLHRRGQRNVEIAQKLGISRQAVGRALNTLANLQAIRQNEAWVSPDSHEAFAMPGDGQRSQLFKDVATLRKKGFKPAQIARELHRFKHTIKSVCRLLDAEPSQR